VNIEIKIKEQNSQKHKYLKFRWRNRALYGDEVEITRKVREKPRGTDVR